jgi:hypothetical protein
VASTHPLHPLHHECKGGRFRHLVGNLEGLVEHEVSANFPTAVEPWYNRKTCNCLEWEAGGLVQQYVRKHPILIWRHMDAQVRLKNYAFVKYP